MIYKKEEELLSKMKKFIFTESQIKKIIDNQIKENEEKKEFRPGVNLGKYDLMSLIGKKKDKEEDEKEKETKKPFSTNKLKSEKKKED